MKENKFNVGDTIVLKEGNVEGNYIIITCTAGDYVLVNRNGNHSIRVLSKIFVDQHALFLNSEALDSKTKQIEIAKESITDGLTESLGSVLSKLDLASTEPWVTIERYNDENDTTEEDYNEKLVQEHQELTAQLNWLYKVKNAKYGDSFGKKVRKRGLMSALDRMEDKWNRLENLIENNEDGSDTDESLEDTLIDLANYCLMTIMEINHAKKNCTYGNHS